jgi:competence protein ComEA
MRFWPKDEEYLAALDARFKQLASGLSGSKSHPSEFAPPRVGRDLFVPETTETHVPPRAPSSSKQPGMASSQATESLRSLSPRLPGHHALPRRDRRRVIEVLMAFPGRWQLSWRGFLVVLLGLLVMSTVVGLKVWRSRPIPITMSSADSPVATPSLLAQQVSPGAGSISTGTMSTEIIVDVSGEVRRPGIAVLPTGSRVSDALNAAGGPLPKADVDDLNLARLLIDGEQILVGGMQSATQPTPAVTPTGALVSLNTASAIQLEELPEVGPVTAAAIISFREAHGGFTSVDQLLEVDGIGEVTLAQIAPHVTL